jgi:hypothetical protein
MRTFKLALLFCSIIAFVPRDASAIAAGVASAMWHDCGAFSGPNRNTVCEDMGGGSVSTSWRQRANIDELAAKVAAIKRSLASPFQLFKPSPEID